MKKLRKEFQMTTAPTSKSAQPKRRLGRGLSSLINNQAAAAVVAEPEAQEVSNSVTGSIEGEYIQTPQADAGDASVQMTETQAGSPMEIRLDQISANPHQPRRDFNDAELNELAESIKQQGILQPLIVTRASEDMKLDTPFVLIAGERRLRAAGLAGLAEVPCVLREATEQQMIEWAVIENIQRSDLNPIERGLAYRDCMSRFNLNQEQVAQRMGQPRATIANYLRMLDLCEEAQGYIASGQISFGHAKVLAGLAGQADRQVELARKVFGEGLSVRKLEELVSAKPKASVASAGKPQLKKQAYVQDIEQQLTEILGTRVTILPSRKKNHGKIVVEYYSLDDFDRISNALGLDVND